MGDPFDPQRGGRDRHLLVGIRGAVVHPERPVDQHRVESEEEADRPGAHDVKHHAAGEADRRDDPHQHDEADAAKRPVRRQQRGEQCGLVRERGFGVALAHARSLYRLHGAQHDPENGPRKAS